MFKHDQRSSVQWNTSDDHIFVATVRVIFQATSPAFRLPLVDFASAGCELPHFSRHFDEMVGHWDLVKNVLMKSRGIQESRSFKFQVYIRGPRWAQGEGWESSNFSGRFSEHVCFWGHVFLDVPGVWLLDFWIYGFWSRRALGIFQRHLGHLCWDLVEWVVDI